MDTNKLKELAELATPGPWTLYVPENYQGPEELPGYGVECAEGRAIIWGALEPETGCQFDRDAEFIAAANPKAILGLITELEQSRSDLPRLVSYAEDLSTCTLTMDDGTGYFYNRVTDQELDEVDRLKAENEALMAAVLKSRTALMVGRPSSKVASHKYTEAFAAIDAALEGGGR